MPYIATSHLGQVQYEEDCLIEFPAGIPAFESEVRFLSLRPPQHAPRVFLQSLANPSLAFISIDARNIAPHYQLELSEEDYEILGGPSEASDVEVLALITVTAAGEVTANLQAPIVVHRERRRAVQSIQMNPAYSCRHPLGVASGLTGEQACS